jgi:hypothetical protein
MPTIASLQRITAAQLADMLLADSEGASDGADADASIAVVDVRDDGMLVCFSVSLFLCFSVSLFLCFSVSLFLCFSVSLFLCFSVSLFLCLSSPLFH